jgi:tetratricopeptide (TPR) repeat protein
MIGSSGRAAALAARSSRCLVEAGFVVAAGFVTVAHAQETSNPPAPAPSPAPEKHGVDVAAVKARVATELANGRAADAEDALREALRDAREPELLLELGGVLVDRASTLQDTSDLGASLRQGVLEEALEVYGEAAKSPIGAVRGALGASVCHALLGRYDAAESTLRDALKQMRELGAKPEERRTLVRELVRYLTELEKESDARALIEDARAAGELDEANVKLEALRIAAAKRESAQTLPLASAAIDAGAEGFQVAYLCWDAIAPGQAETTKPQLESLLNVYSRLLERRPNELALLYYRGATRYRLGDAAGAIADLEPCVDGPPEFAPRARALYGRALVRVARAEEALASFEKLLETGGEFTNDALNGLVDVAVQRARSRDFAGALQLYQRVLARDPTNVWARIGEPLCLRSLNEYDKAGASYEEGLRILPEEPQLLNDYALMLKARGQKERAHELFERALGSGGGKAAADGGENLGIIAYRDQRDPVAAGKYFARTLLIDANRPRVRFYRELCIVDGGR